MVDFAYQTSIWTIQDVSLEQLMAHEVEFASVLKNSSGPERVDNVLVDIQRDLKVSQLFPYNLVMDGKHNDLKV